NALAGDEPSAIVLSQVDGVAHRVRLRDGAAVWKSAPIGRTDGSPAVNHGRIVYGSCNSSLHVIAADDGRILAEIPLCDDCQVAGGVALHGDRAFSGSRSGGLFAVDLQTPAIAWTNAVTTGEVFSTPAVDDGLALFGSNDGTLFALDPSTGATVWTFAAGQAVSSPLLAAERVAFSAGGNLYVLARATGDLLWSQAVSDRITAPAVAAGLLLVGADEGTLTAFGAPP
ncbi:MAG: PQQ-binding-like beta-propeller repeat protein, partial [Verrucomicrobia bacterium]|nr:PQQ-binding-like beta-propeller repeat protein [Verrucomicrobiota bacterium]